MNGDTSDTGSLTDQLNTVASTLDGTTIEDSEYNPIEVEVLCDDMRAVVKPQAAEFYTGTTLSEQEAEIMALNIHGLRPLTIALVLSVSLSSSLDVEAVQDSLENVREEYETAALTFKMLDEHISRSKNWECPDCEALIDLNNYVSAPQQCPSCGYGGFLEVGKPK